MKGLVLGCLLLLLGAHAWAQTDSMSDAGHDGAQSGGGDNCPQGTTYISMGDGCQKAQAAGSVQRTNFFTGFTGQSYSTRPPWNVAGVDYAVGYSGTLTPVTSATLPSCMSKLNSKVYVVNGDVQPCVISHIDFSVNGGYCVEVQGTGRNTITFTNDHFADGSNNCPYSDGYSFIFVPDSSNSNLLVEYSEFDDYSSGSTQTNGVFNIDPSGGQLTLKYNAFLGVGSRVMIGNYNDSSSYNYVEGMGTPGGQHGEIVEYGTTSPLVYSETWNTYYVESTNCCNTAIIYFATGLGNSVGGEFTTASALYNVFVVRQGPNQYNPVAAPVWIQTIAGTVIQSLMVENNYIDSNGSLISPPIYVYPPDSGTGHISNGTCTGNKSLNTGRAIRGGLGRGTSTLVCR